MKNDFALEKPSSFSIYDAAAGSGKTFTLVKEYLKQILAVGNEDYFKHLLAITFTNKAVAEMKQRIVDALVHFSHENSVAQPLPMMVRISEETGKPLAAIQRQAQKILKNLLHNYAAFSVETIDSFNHRLIRTFARDLKLATNFEVTLETDALLAEAVDLLLSRAGQNKEITQVLLDFALSKTDDDKSWDISRDIAKAAHLLYDENDADHVAQLKQKSLQDFLEFKKQLNQKKENLFSEIENLAAQTLELIAENGLEHADFSRGTLPNHFLKIKSGNFDAYANKLQENLESGKGLYKVKVAAFIVETIDRLLPSLLSNYLAIKERVFQHSLYDSILKNITPLSVINLVNQEIEALKEEKNVFPISEFNSLINKQIKNQPAPFIYERLGEKYRHFFIDEFQDTSKLQWENLKPLIENALSQYLEPNSGSLLLVGDAKQSIYRWRGGLPEQFMGLYGTDKPFQREKKVFSLKTNYRSCDEIIKFNNDFFTYVSSVFADEIHQNLYLTGNQQECNTKTGGFVKFEFIEKQSKAEKMEAYSAKVLEAILEVRKKGFSDRDICILTRKKADGIALGGFLMEQGVPVISSETLLLQSATLVQMLVGCLHICVQPKNEQAKIQLLDLLHEHQKIAEEKHSFFTKFLGVSEKEFVAELSNFGIDFNPEFMRSVGLYESLEYCIEKLNLANAADAYLFGFMDLVFEFGQQPQADKISFLDFWETKKDSASIPAGEGTNAVQLMTIHKAKGLEFPVVIFPFADMQLYDGKYDTLWYPLGNADFTFTEALINFKAEIANYGEVGARMYNEHRSRLELDNINLLYVTLTRAIEKLYVFAEMPTEPKEGGPSCYNHLFMEFLKHEGRWNSEQMVYEFGKNSDTISKGKESVPQREPLYFSSNPMAHGLKMVASEEIFMESETIAAIIAGNLLHETMAKIFAAADAAKVLEELEKRSIIPAPEFEVLTKMVHQIIGHPELEALFNGSDVVYNEQSIITKNGALIRPDRINVSRERTVTIVDYKTGSPKNYHLQQLDLYEEAVMEMGFAVSEKILVYNNEEGLLINKV